LRFHSFGRRISGIERKNFNGSKKYSDQYIRFAHYAIHFA
jgi:hypothetical protein